MWTSNLGMEGTYRNTASSQNSRPDYKSILASTASTPPSGSVSTGCDSRQSRRRSGLRPDLTRARLRSSAPVHRPSARSRTRRHGQGDQSSRGKVASGATPSLQFRSWTTMIVSLITKNGRKKKKIKGNERNGIGCTSHRHPRSKTPSSYSLQYAADTFPYTS